MENSNSNTYAPPVASLLTYGVADSASSDKWPDYLALGLGPEHIPDLIRMATDKELNEADSESLEVWAPLHAWRALGQLRAEEAVKPLLSLFEFLADSESADNEWAYSEIPKVFALIGPSILPVLTDVIADASSHEDSRICGIMGVEKIATSWPETRPDGIAILMKQLALFTENDPVINRSLIFHLVVLKATEAAPLMEEAFKAERVDLFMMDWEAVQEELGLLPAEKIEQRSSRALSPSFYSSPLPYEGTPSDRPAREKSPRGTTHKKAKEKMAKQSRKKNRRR